ncbi:DUF2878 domain-containing protein [Marinobacteraceae bacterium S3BR75-40.1]
MSHAQTAKNVVNFVIFQTAWFICVLRQDDVAAGITLALVVLHLAIISQHRERELRFLIMAAILGISVDTFWQNLGVLSFPAHQGAYASGMLPGWMLTIWLIFATTLHHSLHWMAKSRVLLLALPPVAGLLAYISAQALGAVEIGHGAWGYVAIAIGWLLVFPTQVKMMEWMEARSARTTTA